jgi:tRNA (guanine-N7-)-methyltransferase
MTTTDPKNREIRSFVRRGGRMTPSQKQALERYWPTYGIDYSSARIQLPPGFDALKIEIGIGNGDALIHMAASDPRSLYIGIDVHEPGIGRCLNQIVKHELDNVRLICYDAVEVLRDMLESESLDRLLLFFPDPWHKKRHHKRRIVNRKFRDLVHRALKPGGVIHVATDWQDYAEWIAEQFLGDDRFANQGDASGYCEAPAYRPQTRFERRGLRLGHGVRDLVFAKKPGSS